MASRRRAKNSNDTLKYFLIGAAALVVLFLVFNVGPTGKFTGTTALDANLVAELSFDSEESGTTPDTGPNSYSATVSGATLVNDGFLGSAYKFDSGDYISLSELDGENFPESGTLSMWIYLTTDIPSSTKKIFSNPAGSQRHATPSRDGAKNVIVIEQRKLGELYIRAQSYECGQYIASARITHADLDKDAWSNIVLTWDKAATKFKMYYQGAVIRDRTYNFKDYEYIWVDKDQDGVLDSREYLRDKFDYDSTIDGYQDSCISGGTAKCADDVPDNWKDTDNNGMLDTEISNYDTSTGSGISTRDCLSGSDLDKDGEDDGGTVTSWVPDEQIVKFYAPFSDSKLDEIRIYDIALTEAQVAALYSAYTANQPPTIETIDDISRTEGSDLSVEVVASDLDGDPLTYSLVSMPVSRLVLAIEHTSGAITGTFPSYEEGGTNQFTITVEVSDGTDTTSESFSITVESANQAPTIQPLGSFSQIEGTTYTEEVSATDPDEDTLIYSITVGISPLESQQLVPAFTLTIDSSSGAITGTLPDISQDTIYRVTVTVTDDATSPASDSEYFDITVLSDADSDGLTDTDDNCPNDKNPDQSDLDEDNIGDACDDDVDGDTILNTADNCPNDVNSDQANFDGDTLGDECDTDVDDDGVINDDDLCPETGEVLTITIDENGCSESQLDANADSDEDGVINSDDLCPATPIDATVNSVGCPDTDGDGIYDNLDFAWDLTQSGLTTDSEEVEVESYALENNGIFSMNLQSSTGLSASCSDGTSTDQTTCESATYTWTGAIEESCSDGNSADQLICEAEGTCPEIAEYDTCDDAEETWIAETWTPASEAVCSDETSTDQDTCEAASVNTWSEASDILNNLQSATALVKVEYYDLETNEILSSTLYTSQVSIEESASQTFSISVPASETAVGYIATVNIWSGMIGTADWQPYSEKIELRGEFHP